MLHQRNMKESHWMVLLFHKNKVYLADPLGIPIQTYEILYCRLAQFYNELPQVLKFKPLQNQNSSSQDFCNYIGRVMYGYE